jgi:hypothetical protein
MKNTEYHSNVILKIFHDSESNRLALLKSRFDCSLYIALVDLGDQSTIIIDIENIFCQYSSQFHGDIRTEDSNRAYHTSNDLVKNFTSDFTLIDSVYTFDVDFNNGHILLQAKLKRYNTTEKEGRNSDRQLNCLILNLKGEIVFQEQIDSKNPHSYNVFLSFWNDQTLFLIDDGYDANLRFWKFATRDFAQIDLIYNDDIILDEVPYEYIRYFDIHKPTKKIGLIFENPTYGVDSIKIFEFNETEVLNPIFNYVYENKNFQFFAFNPLGDEFSLLEYTNSQEYNKANVSIHTYSLNVTHKPKSTIITTVNYHSDFIKRVQYYSAEILCIATHQRLILYNLITGDVVVELPGYDQYFISHERIFYFLNKRLRTFNIIEGHNPKPKIRQRQKPKVVYQPAIDIDNEEEVQEKKVVWPLVIAFIIAVWTILRLLY